MCGIVGYIGYREAYPIVIKGLKRLEYRGYDSAGVMLYDGETMKIAKAKGKVVDLEEKTSKEITTNGTIGIGHTRWATHGVPNDVNSHPHLSNSGDLAIIHNGIIENYAPLKAELVKRGYVFHSDTDTEVLVNLIEEVQKKDNLKLGKAVQVALNQVIGAYAIAVFDIKTPNEIVAARLGSPLAIGIGEGEYFIASDASPFIEYTSNAIYLEDGEMANIRLHKPMKVRKIKDDSLVNPTIQELQMNLEQIEKGGFDHFMLKEIYEQPNVIKDTYRGRLHANKGLIQMAGVEDNLEKFLNADRILIVRHLPFLRCGRPAHQQDVQRHPGDAHPHRQGGGVPERAQPVPEQGQGPGDPAQPLAGPKAEGTAGRHQLRAAGAGGHRGPQREDPHLQFPAGPLHRPPHRPDGAQPCKDPGRQPR